MQSVAARALLAILLLFAIGACASHAPSTVATARDQRDDRILVTVPAIAVPRTARLDAFGRLEYTPPFSARAGNLQTARELANEFDLVLEEDWLIPALDVYCFVFRLPPKAQREQLLTLLAHHPGVDSAQPLQFFSGKSSTGTSGSDPLSDPRLQQQLRAVHASNAGNGSTVAIIDTGVDADHEDLRGANVTRIDVVGGDVTRAETHGTAVLGVLAAQPDNARGIRGYAPAARMMSIRACWQEDDSELAVCNSFTLAKAMSLALQTGADIVNLSISGPSDPLLERVGAALVSRGIMIVAAGTHEGFPGSINGSLLATDLIAADPVMTLLPGNRYGIRQGSSLSAARLSGLMAVLRNVAPGTDVRTLTRGTADDPALAGFVEVLHMLHPATARIASD